MTLRVLTAGGTLELGAPPAVGPVCERCGAPAQITVDCPIGILSVCAPCVERLVIVHRLS
jgi:hypothetical protein